MRLTLLALLCLAAQDDPIAPLAGKAPPELSVTWADGGPPLTLAALKGQVVWLQFSFRGSPACDDMRPHLARWHSAGFRRGLTIIDVDTTLVPGLEALKADVEKSPRGYAVARDTGRTAPAYALRRYPAGVLVGVDGRVLWSGAPLGAIAGIEGLIDAELKKIAPRRRNGGYLGLRFEEAADGLRIVGLLDDHPVQEAGLRVGDVITGLRDAKPPLRDVRFTGDHFIQRLWMTPKIAVEVRRGRERLERELSLKSLDARPRVGDPAPDFTLASPDGKAETMLSKLVGAKPVVLVFGSYT
jgi:hypothetical protein